MHTGVHDSIHGIRRLRRTRTAHVERSVCHQASSSNIALRTSDSDVESTSYNCIVLMLLVLVRRCHGDTE